MSVSLLLWRPRRSLPPTSPALEKEKEELKSAESSVAALRRQLSSIREASAALDVEILEVDRSRSKNYGLNLSEYAVGGIFSPENSPSGTTTATTGTTGTTGGTTGGTTTGGTPPR